MAVAIARGPRLYRHEGHELASMDPAPSREALLAQALFYTNNHPADAEDLVQEVYVRYLCQSNVRRPRQWCFIAMRNLAADWRREQERRAAKMELVVLTDDIPAPERTFLGLAGANGEVTCQSCGEPECRCWP